MRAFWCLIIRCLPRSKYSPFQVSVSRGGAEPGVFDGPADREMVEALPSAHPVREAEHLVHQVVEEAADSRGAHPQHLGLQVENLADHPAFPVKARPRG